MSDACSVPGCDRPLKYKAKRLCNAHGARLLRFGDVLAHAPCPKRERRSGSCSVPGCRRPAQTKGMCNAHYQRVRRGSDVGPPIGRGDECDHTLCPIQEQAREWMSHEEIAKEMGISPQRVGQIERRALWKLRRMLDARGVCFADLLPDEAAPFEGHRFVAPTIQTPNP